MSLKSLPKISVQKLFAVALTLKIISSGVGLLLSDPWILGMALPIAIMVGYMVIGNYSREEDISSEKFADSCYYIGFIFTMTSIIFSLFDLPNLGAGEGMRNIALRFGAAMVSTVLGMGVRVYLVSFRKDASDGIRDAEEAVLDATRMLVSRLNTIVDELKSFEIHVMDASKMTVENVNRQISELSQTYAISLNGFYVQLTEENRAIFKLLLNEVRHATSSLAGSVQSYSSAIDMNLDSIEQKITSFAEAVSSRLANTTFPDDFFARNLKAPLNQLTSEAYELGANVRTVSSLVQESSTTLATVLKQINSKAKKTQEAMDAVVRLSDQQRILVGNADLQLSTLVQLAQRMEQIDSALTGALEVISKNSNAPAELLTNVSSLSMEGSRLRLDIKDAIFALTSKLDANTTLATDIIGKLDSHVGGWRTSASDVMSSIERHSDSSNKVAQQLVAAVGVLHNVAQHLEMMSRSSAQVRGSLRHADQTEERAAQRVFEEDDFVYSGIAQGTEVAGQIQDVDMAIPIETENLSERAHQPRRWQDGPETVIAESVVPTTATKSAHSAADRVSGSSDVGDLRIDSQSVINRFFHTEQIVSNVKLTDKRPDLSSTSSTSDQE